MKNPMDFSYRLGYNKNCCVNFEQKTAEMETE